MSAENVEQLLEALREFAACAPEEEKYPFGTEKCMEHPLPFSTPEQLRVYINGINGRLKEAILKTRLFLKVLEFLLNHQDLYLPESLLSGFAYEKDEEISERRANVLENELFAVTVLNGLLEQCVEYIIGVEGE